MRIAGLEGRCKKRWRKTTVVDPDAERALDLIERHFGPCTSSTGAMSATSPIRPSSQLCAAVPADRGDRWVVVGLDGRWAVA